MRSGPCVVIGSDARATAMAAAVRQRRQRWDGNGNDGGGGNKIGNNGRQGKCDSHLGGSRSGRSRLGLGTAAAEPGRGRRRRGGARATAASARLQWLRRKCDGKPGSDVIDGGGAGLVLGTAAAASGRWRRQQGDLPLSPSILTSKEF